MRSFSSLLTLVLVSVLSSITAAALDLPAPFCDSIDMRKEWRQLTTTQKQSYIASVLCLKNAPPLDTSTVATSRYDEFQLAHINLTPQVHVVGQFLPWHRQYVTLYTNALRNECGYDGPTPYWDWTIDADGPLPMEEWPIFDPVNGFGGDGLPGTYTLPPDPNGVQTAPGGPPMYLDQWKGCVQDGPFASVPVNLGPGRLNVPHCLVRGFNETAYRSFVTSTTVNKALSKTTFREFHMQMDSFTDGFHTGGHWLLGGDVGDPWSSPADPLFFLHHANIDRIWWKWQLANPFTRLYQIQGFTTAFPLGTTPVTTDFVMPFGGLGPDIKVRDTMNSLFEPNCFLYMS